MPTSEVMTHGPNRRNNAGVRISLHTNHGNVLKKEKNAFVIKDGLSMVLKLVPTRKNLISSEQSSFQWLSLVLMERELSNVTVDHSTVLIQLQMLTKHASVIKRRSTLTNHSLLLLRLSGSHHKPSLNQKVNSREMLNIPRKLTKSPKKRKVLLKSQLLLLELKTTKLSLTSKLPRLVQSNLLRKPINSERLRSNKRRLLAQRLSPKRELLSTQCNSN
jgi:hypothetical protein